MPFPHHTPHPPTTLTSQDHTARPGATHSIPGKVQAGETGWKDWGYGSWKGHDVTEESKMRATHRYTEALQQ
eukprot:9299821-Heterocapsa_arctica.AAC.1